MLDTDGLRPSSDRFGQAPVPLRRCRRCGHGAPARPPDPAVLAAAYAATTDPELAEEEVGRRATAERALRRIEAVVGVGRLLDVGCWDGTLLAVACERGWAVEGIEPSRWAAAQARARGLVVHATDLDHAPVVGPFDAVCACDVLEHLVDPAAAADRLRGLLRPGGVLYVTVPDAGSVVARLLGHRWWSVLPTHLHYFTRRSLRTLLARHGFTVHRMATHPKVFTVGYYAGRLERFLPAVGGLVAQAVALSGVADRLVAPDLRDRLEVLAVRR